MGCFSTSDTNVILPPDARLMASNTRLLQSPSAHMYPLWVSSHWLRDAGVASSPAKATAEHARHGPPCENQAPSRQGWPATTAHRSFARPGRSAPWTRSSLHSPRHRSWTARRSRWYPFRRWPSGGRTANTPNCGGAARGAARTTHAATAAQDTAHYLVEQRVGDERACSAQEGEAEEGAHGGGTQASIQGEPASAVHPKMSIHLRGKGITCVATPRALAATAPPGKPCCTLLRRRRSLDKILSPCDRRDTRKCKASGGASFRG